MFNSAEEDDLLLAGIHLLELLERQSVLSLVQAFSRWFLPKGRCHDPDAGPLIDVFVFSIRFPLL